MTSELETWIEPVPGYERFRYRSMLTESLAVDVDRLTYAKPFAKGEVRRHLEAGRSWGSFLVVPAVVSHLTRVAPEVAVLWRGRHTVVVARDEVTGVRLEGRGRFGHLTIATGDDELDMRRCRCGSARRRMGDVDTPDRLREHDISLRSDRVLLRPMTEGAGVLRPRDLARDI